MTCGMGCSERGPCPLPAPTPAGFGALQAAASRPNQTSVVLLPAAALQWKTNCFVLLYGVLLPMGVLHHHQGSHPHPGVTQSSRSHCLGLPSCPSLKEISSHPKRSQPNSPPALSSHPVHTSRAPDPVAAGPTALCSILSTPQGDPIPFHPAGPTVWGILSCHSRVPTWPIPPCHGSVVVSSTHLQWMKLGVGLWGSRARSSLSLLSPAARSHSSLRSASNTLHCCAAHSSSTKSSAGTGGGTGRGQGSGRPLPSEMGVASTSSFPMSTP